MGGGGEVLWGRREILQGRLGKLEGKRLLGISRSKWEDDIKIDSKK